MHSTILLLTVLALISLHHVHGQPDHFRDHRARSPSHSGRIPPISHSNNPDGQDEILLPELESIQPSNIDSIIESLPHEKFNRNHKLPEGNAILISCGKKNQSFHRKRSGKYRAVVWRYYFSFPGIYKCVPFTSKCVSSASILIVRRALLECISRTIHFCSGTDKACPTKMGKLCRLKRVKNVDGVPMENEGIMDEIPGDIDRDTDMQGDF